MFIIIQLGTLRATYTQLQPPRYPIRKSVQGTTVSEGLVHPMIDINTDQSQDNKDIIQKEACPIHLPRDDTEGDCRCGQEEGEGSRCDNDMAQVVMAVSLVDGLGVRSHGVS